MTVSSRLIRTTELGLEQQCSCCQEWWPADTEFFHAHPEGALGLRSTCKVCALIAEAIRKGRRRPQPPAPQVPDVFNAIQWGGGQRGFALVLQAPGALIEATM